MVKTISPTDLDFQLKKFQRMDLLVEGRTVVAAQAMGVVVEVMEAEGIKPLTQGCSTQAAMLVILLRFGNRPDLKPCQAWTGPTQSRRKACPC